MVDLHSYMVYYSRQAPPPILVLYAWLCESGYDLGSGYLALTDSKGKHIFSNVKILSSHTAVLGMYVWLCHQPTGHVCV